jgi:hypothetical protein
VHGFGDDEQRERRAAREEDAAEGAAERGRRGTPATDEDGQGDRDDGDHEDADGDGDDAGGVVAVPHRDRALGAIPAAGDVRAADEQERRAADENERVDAADEPGVRALLEPAGRVGEDQLRERPPRDGREQEPDREDP